MRGQSGTWAAVTASVVLVLGMGVAMAAEKTEAKEAWLGVYSQTLTPELSEGLNYNGSGALVSRVVDGGPADKAGLKSGDVIVGVNTTTIASATDLTKAIQAMKVGQAASLRIIRDGTRATLSAKLAERPAEESEGGEAPEAPAAPRARDDGGDFSFSFDGMPGFAMFNGGRGRLGVRVQNLNPDLGGYFGVPDGKGVLVVEVLKDTPAEKAGLKAGDVITKVGDKKVEDSDDLVSALRDADKKVTLTIRRKNATKAVESELRDTVVRHDGSMSWRNDDDVRRQLEELRRELRDLKTKLEDKSSN